MAMSEISAIMDNAVTNIGVELSPVVVATPMRHHHQK
jgi:hypothetical protein